MDPTSDPPDADEAPSPPEAASSDDPGTDLPYAPRTGSGGQMSTPIRLGAVIAVALAAGFAAWLFVRDDDGPTSATTTTAPTATPAPTATTATVPTTSTSDGPPQETSEAELQRMAIDGATMYWAGPAESGYTLTLLQTPGGASYVRYLPPGVEVTDPIPPSLVVATYPLQSPLAAIKRAAKSPDSVAVGLKNGGIAVYSKQSPTNVYFAFPKSSHQIEVYDPSPGRALQLVTSGTVTQVSP